MKKAGLFISNIGYHPGLSAEEARRIRLLTYINILAFSVLMVYVITWLFLCIYSFIPCLLLMQICVVLDLYLLHKGKIAFAKHFCIWIVTLSICFFALFTGINTFSEALFIPLSVAPLIIFQNKRTAYSYLAFFVVLMIVIKSLQPYAIPFVHISNTLRHFFQLLNLVSSAVVAFFLTWYFKQANVNYESQLIRMHEMVSEKNKEVTDSITYAQRIQNAMLPPVQLIEKQFPGSFILFLPKDIVAGDFYWLEVKNNTVIFAAADCTGHGVPGAMVSVICSNALNRTVKEFGLTAPGAMLDKTRTLVIETFVRGDAAIENETEVKDGMDISLCTYDPATKLLQWAGANNPLWIVRNSELLEYKANKQPIGKTDDPKPFTTHSIQLQANDRIYVFTDGYADQFGGPKGKKFKYSQLKALLLATAHLDMKAQQAKLQQELTDWKGDLEQVDDILIMGMQI